MPDVTVSSRAPWQDRAKAFGRVFYGEVMNDRLLGLAAETAFFGVLSLFPGLLIAAGLLSALEVIVGADVAAAVKDQVVATLSLVLTDAASGVIESVANLFEGSRGGLVTFATLGALFTLSGGFAVVIGALNLAYDTRERRSWWHRRLLGLAMALATTVVTVLALAVLVVGPLLGRGERLADLVGLGSVFAFVWNALRIPVAFATLVLWSATLFHIAPSRRTRWRDSLPGAFLTATLWIVASAGFNVYLRVVADQNPVLGAFGGGVIVMTWAYLLSLALLLGGELNAVLHDRRHLRE